MTRTYSAQVRFVPWVGDHYDHGFEPGIRLLILGESHYDPGESREFTKQVVQDYLDSEANKFFTNIHQAISGLAYSDPNFDRRKFWHSVAFYNFVQDDSIEGPRAPPTQEMFFASYPAFREVLNQLVPTHVLALGERLWTNMPPFDGGEGYQIRMSPELALEFGWYMVNGHRAIAHRIRHPSAGFSAPDWHPTIRSVLSISVLPLSGRPG